MMVTHELYTAESEFIADTYCVHQQTNVACMRKLCEIKCVPQKSSLYKQDKPPKLRNAWQSISTMGSV